MVFSSLLFLYLFFPALLLAYFVFKNTAYRNWVLIVFSFAFYAWGEPVWVVLLLLASLIGYLLAIAIDRLRGTWQGKLIFVFAISLNIAILGFFKYTGFLVDNINDLFGTNISNPDVGLPIGISFFTFEIICYLSDVYKGAVKAPRSPTKMLLYVSFFPHLVAGPIIRYSDIEKQMEKRTVTLAGFSEGINRFIIGLGKKVIIANMAGETVSVLLDGGASSVAAAWFGVCLFAIQIYFDFSGYSDMAIGLGKMFGINLNENFNHPYISRSAGEFWRRWNMSLGGFFRDYVYIPLGGNRSNYIRNLFVVWLLTGLWHGASWNFIIWGLYFGLLILLERLFLSKWLDALPRFVSHVYFLLIMLVGWVWFYFVDIGEACHTLLVMFGMTDLPLSTVEFSIYFNENVILFIVAIVGSTPLFRTLINRTPSLRGYADWAQPVYNAIVLIIATILLVGSTYNPFLYYRF